VIAISESQRDELGGKYHVVPRQKIAVIQNGFELSAFSAKDRQETRKELGLCPEQFVLVWAGRMAPVKEVELLGQVIRKAASEKSAARFLVVGDGEQRADLEVQIQGCNSVVLLDGAATWKKCGVQPMRRSLHRATRERRPL
jgi:glycosyltransferase involved in cell wall biosynthesis